MFYKTTVFREFKIKKLKPHFIGKHHTQAAVRHFFEEQQTTQVVFQHIYLRAVQRIGELRLKLPYAAHITTAVLQAAVNGAAGA